MKYTHPSVIKLFGTLQEYIPILEEGTTGGADPTAWSRGNIEVKLRNGTYRVSVTNFWDTEIKVSRRAPLIPGLKNNFSELADYMISREYVDKKGYQDTVTQHYKGTGGLILISRILKELKATGINYADQAAQEEKLKRLLMEYYKKAVHPDLTHKQFKPHWDEFCKRNFI